MGNVKLSVLMPVYNAQKYLKEAIESILAQTFADFEFLIIDDGSTDESVEIIQSYDDDRVRLVQNDHNIGLSKTLNRGIELSKSDLIARMDADDVSLPDRLKKQYSFMVENPDIKLLSTQIERISESGKTISRSSSDFKFLYFQLIFHCFGIYHPSVMYRKHAVADVGMYPETHSEDFRLWSKIIRKYRFFHMSEVLLKYRLSEQSISHTTLQDAYRADELNYAKDNLQYFMGDNYTIPKAWLNAYRENTQEISERSDIHEMVKCIREIDNIAQKVIKKDNVNRNAEDILNAAKLKKKQIIKKFLRKVSLTQGLKLIIRFGYLKLLVLYILPDSIKRWVKKNVRNNTALF